MNKYRQQRKTKFTKKGFSLIEVLVSLSIFTVVVTIGVGALLVLIDANSRAQNMQSVMTNLTFAFDSMTREIRTGEYYYCGAVSTLPTNESNRETANCASGNEGLAIREGGESLTAGASSRRIAYRLNGGAIERRLGSGNWDPVTAPNITIDTLEFYVTGATRRDDSTPSVTIYLAGTAGAGDVTETFFDIQTTVVQQLLDI